MFRQLVLSAAAGLLLAPALAADPPAAPGPDTVYPAAQIRADFDQLYNDLRAAHYDLFAATPQAVFDQRHAEMRAGFDAPMTRLDVQTQFQIFTALARHGHARLDFPMDAFETFRAAGGSAFPVAIRVRHGAVFVESVPAGTEGLAPGDEILALNGEPNTVWMPQLTRHISAETPLLAHTLLELFLPRLIWLEWHDMTDATLRVRGADGAERDVTVPFLSREALEARGTVTAPSFDLAGREARMIGEDIAYLRPGPFYNDTPGTNMWDASDFVAFIDTSFEDFIAAGAEHLILDLRDNPGGDSSFSDPVIAWFADEPFVFASEFRIRVSEHTTASNRARLEAQPDMEGGISAVFAELYASRENGEAVSFDLPEAQPRDGARFEGEVHVLINRYSFSNAVSVAAVVQDYGFGTIAGEATADMSTTYGAMEQFALENTGLMVGYPKAHIIRPNGETRSHPVSPDVALDLPVVRGPEDVALEQLVGIIRRGG